MCRALVLAAAAMGFAMPAAAQPTSPPPPASQIVAPIGPPVARPPLPAPATGTLTRSGQAVEARSGVTPPSRWQAALNDLDSDLRLRLLTAHEPQAAWLAGELDTTDIEAQVRHYTDARTAAPQEELYLASLASACLVRVRPQLASCAAVDRLADWARRDADNGVPSILLADRARARGEIDQAVSHVDEAARSPRFDDYGSQGALRWWNYLRPLQVAVDPAVKAEAAARYAAARELSWAPALGALCADPGGRSEPMKAACENLGRAMLKGGATFALRRAGARIAETNAPDDAARATAQSAHARVLEATARCARAEPDFATDLESRDEAVRARGVEQFGAWANAQSRDGEIGACERLEK